MSPLGRRAPLTRTPMKRKTPKRTGPARDVRALVIARDDGRCVRCGRAGSNVHHRSGRGMGGAHGERADRINGPAWLVVVCGSGNTSGCHGWAEANRDRQPERDGYVIRRSDPRDATSVPIHTTRGWVLLDDDGGYSRTDAPGEAA